MGLEQIKQDSIRITEELETELNDLPRNQTCIHTEYPKKMWCIERQIFAGYAICEKCPEYKERGVN